MIDLPNICIFKPFNTPICPKFSWCFWNFLEHQNFFGLDENLGPVAISLRREKIDDSFRQFAAEKSSSSVTTSKTDGNNIATPQASNSAAPMFQYRFIVRTSEVGTTFDRICPAPSPSFFYCS